MRTRIGLGFLLASLGMGCVEPTRPADLILLNGRVVTVDANRPEAQALAARDGILVAVGLDDEIERYRGPDTEVIDLAGRLAIPGFIEGHGHFTELGRALSIVDLKGARNWDEVVQRVADRAERAEPGEWIYGRGWHQEKWDSRPSPEVEGYPVHASLSRATPNNPVLLTHASGHAAVANARALESAGIDASTPDPPGGKILRDAEGQPTGLLRETAQALVGRAADLAREKLSAERIESQARREIVLADRECLSKGVTSFQDAGSGFGTVDRLKTMYEAGEINVRLWVMLSESNEVLRRRVSEYRIVDAVGGRLSVRAIKRAIDGALGSHGAWLLDPYADQPGSTGHNTTTIEVLEETARIAAESGFQLCVHAIGDRGNRETLDLFERTFDAYPEKTDLRWRIEHAQHLSLQDIPRFAELGVIASMQAVHCVSDAPWVSLRLGPERAEQGAYVWRKLLDSGARISNGTDTPVEDVDPIANFHASVTRRTRGGELFFPEQRMTREEALESMTLGAAYAAFEERTKGSLAPGKLADVVVLSRDLLRVPEDEILDTEVLLTIVGGRVVYRRTGL